MKKLLSVCLILILAFSMLDITSVSAEYDSSDDLFTEEYNYEILEDDTAAINKYLGSDTQVSVPSEIEGYKVTAIHRYAFADQKELKSVTIPEGVISIGFAAFSGCTSLEELNLPDSLQEMHFMYIDDTKLYRDPNNWDNGVLYIGNHLIQAHPTPLSGTYTVREGTVSITYRAFEDCAALTEVILPDSLKYIGNSAFSDCTSLTKINLTDNITRIDPGAFEDCPLSEVHIPSSLTKLEDYTFRGAAFETVTLPENLEYIGSYAFQNCKKLKEITIPESVKTMEDGVFFNCESLEKIRLPENLEALGRYILHNTSYYNNEENWENGLLYFDNYLVDAKNLSGNVTVKDGTTLIGLQVFAIEKNLVSVNFPDSLKDIGSYCFSECVSLRAVDLPKTLTEIPKGAFSGCLSLETLYIPDGVKSIGDNAFLDCEKLKYIRIPASVESFGENSVGFYNPYSNFEDIDMPVMPEDYSKLKNLVIAGYEGSAAEKYANEHGFTFENLNTPTTFRYKDKVLELLNLSDNPEDGDDYIAHYEEIYDYVKDSSATPDFVLIEAYSNMVMEADYCYNFGEYIMYETSTSTPAPFGYFVYIPATNRLYSIIEAYEMGVEGVETLFENKILGEMMGDANNDEKLNIRDATIIQKDLAGMVDIYYYFNDKTYAGKVSDFNGDDKLSIRDATAIQKYLAGVDLNNPNYEDFENSAYESTVKHTKVTINGKDYDLRSDEIMTLEVVLTSDQILRDYFFDVNFSPYYCLSPQSNLTGAEYLAAHCPNAPADSELQTSKGYNDKGYVSVQVPKGEYDFTEGKVIYRMSYTSSYTSDTKIDVKLRTAFRTDGVIACSDNEPYNGVDIKIECNVSFERLPKND